MIVKCPKNFDKKRGDIAGTDDVDLYLEKFNKQHKGTKSNIFFEYEKITSSKTKKRYFYITKNYRYKKYLILDHYSQVII